jgi:hypothetical protein
MPLLPMPAICQLHRAMDEVFSLCDLQRCFFILSFPFSIDVFLIYIKQHTTANQWQNKGQLIMPNLKEDSMLKMIVLFPKAGLNH